MQPEELKQNPLVTQSANPIPPQEQPSPFIDSSKLRLVGMIAVLLLITVGLAYYSYQSDKASHSSTSAGKSLQQSTSQLTEAAPTAQMQTITGSPNNVSSLPLGDNKYTTSGPKKGYIYLCNVQSGGGGAQEVGSWIHGTTWDLSAKTSVQGQVSWPNATFSMQVSGNNRIISGNDLPYHTTTGIFPIQSSDPAYKIDRNPNTITAHSFTLTLPANPAVASSPSCMGGEVGVMTNGVPLFNGFDAEHRDAAAHEVQDSCDGHPQESGEYHYHSLSSCIKDINETTVIGYALDGFPITGPVLPNGNYITTNDLDECHGTTSEITLDGKQITMYHYVMTEDFPYSVSCFKGKPVSMQVISNLKNQSSQSQPNSINLNTKQPPQEAVTACSGKTSGSSCAFTTPRGTVSGICQTPPNQTSLVCGPSDDDRGFDR